MKVVVADLDSTIAHTQHRHHLIDRDRPGGTDWVAYSMACSEDTPIPGTVALLRLCHDADVHIVIMSGRDEAARALTEAWLDKHCVPWDEMVLRQPADKDTGLNNAALKRRNIEAWVAAHPGAELLFMLEDWPPVAEALNDLLPVVLVNPAYEYPEATPAPAIGGI